jgi:hypothetical protein
MEIAEIWWKLDEISWDSWNLMDMSWNEMEFNEQMVEIKWTFYGYSWDASSTLA